MSQQVDLHCTFQPSTDKDAEISSALHPLNTVLKNKSRKSPFQPLSSSYRGVSLKSNTGKWKSALKVGKTTYTLGNYSSEEAAARAYDLASICVRGIHNNPYLNFNTSEYSQELDRLTSLTIEELAKQLQAHAAIIPASRKSSSVYRGVRLHSRTGKKFEAILRIGKHKQISLGLYSNELQAAQAYDQGAILRHCKGIGPMGPLVALPSLNFPAERYSVLCNGEETEEYSDPVMVDADIDRAANNVCHPDASSLHTHHGDKHGESTSKDVLAAVTEGSVEEDGTFEVYELQERYITAVIDACDEYLKSNKSGGGGTTAKAATEKEK